MKFQGAFLQEQGVNFGVAVVKKRILDNKTEAERLVRQFQPLFNGYPVILMAQDHRGNPTYYGRKDISRFMASVPLHAIPWREYTVY